MADTDAEDVVEDEMELEVEYEVKGVLEVEIDPVCDSMDETETDGRKLGVSKEDPDGSSVADTSELWETDGLELSDA